MSELTLFLIRIAYLAILGSALFAGLLAPVTQSAAVTAFVDQPELGPVATAIKANFAAMATGFVSNSGVAPIDDLLQDERVRLLVQGPQRRRIRHERTRDEHPTPLAGGHLVQRLQREMSCLDPLKRIARLIAHLRRNAEVTEYALAAEQS